MGALDTTFGALFIGVVFAAVLYGFTCVQTWYYFIHYPLDPWYIKLLAVAVLIADTTHQALITHSLYLYLVTNWGVPSFLEKIVWSLIVEVLFNAFTAFMVQSFLVMRIYKLSNKNLFLTGAAGALVIAQFFESLIYAAKNLRIREFTRLGPVRGLTMAINGTTAGADIVIALILCLLLHRSRSSFERSNLMINKLIVFSVNTGLVTSVFALVSLIALPVWPNTFIYIAFYLCMSRLYCNTLLATLNARKILRGATLHDDMVLTSSGMQKTSTGRLGTRSAHVPNNISIMVDTTRECTHDEYSSTYDVKTPEVAVV